MKITKPEYQKYYETAIESNNDPMFSFDEQQDKENI